VIRFHSRRVSRRMMNAPVVCFAVVSRVFSRDWSPALRVLRCPPLFPPVALLHRRACKHLV